MGAQLGGVIVQEGLGLGVEVGEACKEAEVEARLVSAFSA
jgi:hypothetical protein